MPHDDDILQAFAGVLAKTAKVERTAVTRDRRLRDELGIDSLSLMQIVGEMESELGVMIPDEDLVEIRTVGDLVKKVEARAGG